jgi:hypothetical protein|tara:strand:- start:2770 stop:4647 length:1878 start_codon:yes stop_codon:yes gene_type:complete
MANSLIAASQNLDKADFGFNPGEEIAKQIGLGLDAFEKKQDSDKAEAHDVLENLNKDLVGFDYMNEQAQEFYENSLGDISPQLAKAKRTKNAKEVRRLEALASNLINDQNLIGELLKNHAEDTLSENYSEGANTHLLDMLTTGKYRIKEIDGERRIVFGKSSQMFDKEYDNFLGGDFIAYDRFTGDLANSNYDKNQIITKQDIIDHDLSEDFLGKNRYTADGMTDDSDGDSHIRRQSYMGGKNGIPLNKLADYAIVNDPTVTVPYTNVLIDIKKDAANGLKFDGSPNKNKLEAILNKMVPNVKYVDEENAHASRPEDDQIANLLYSRDFNLTNGKNLAELWVEEHKDIVAKEFKNNWDEFGSRGMRYATYFAGGDLEASDLKPGTAIYDMAVTNRFEFSGEGYFKKWLKEKLTTGASNYHKYNLKEQGGGGGGGAFDGVDLKRQLNINNTFSSDTVVREYMSKLKNGETILFSNKSGTTTEYNNNGDGTYTLKGGSGNKLSKNRIAEIMGLPGGSQYDYGNVVVGEADGGGIIDANMILGTEEQVVNGFKDNTYLKDLGFTFDTEFDMGGRAMNIYFGGKGVMIDLDDANAVEKINEYFNKKIGNTATNKNKSVDMGDGNSNEEA